MASKVKVSVLRRAQSQEVVLVFGALAPKLAVQLSNLGIVWYPTNRDITLWQTDADAVTHLQIRGMISDSVATRARMMIVKAIRRKNLEDSGRLPKRQMRTDDVTTTEDKPVH